MATGGIFLLVTNDGKQDRMLMATALLNERLRAIKAYNQNLNGGSADDLGNLPTLLDIEKTHVLFTNAHFKPFAAMTYEYNKVPANSGNPSLGASLIQFSIPQFGDFFHDICCHAILRQPTLVPTAGTAVSDQPLMRWCSYPGEQLLQKVSFDVNNNPLDAYNFHAVNMHREYRVAPNKALGWNRCVGQEEAQHGFVDQPNWEHSGVSPANIQNRVVSDVLFGNQTPTGQKAQDGSDDLELFIPLLFWFNKDVRLSVPSVAIPYGQRFISLTLANLNQLCGVVPRGTSTWANPRGTVAETVGPTLSKIELFINNIFVNPEVHSIYIKRIGFSLIRVHREQTFTVNSSNNELLMQQLKWPIEYMFVGMKVNNYFQASTPSVVSQYLDRWHTFSQVTDVQTQTTGQNVLESSLLVTDGTTVAISATTGLMSLSGTGSALLQTLTPGTLVQVNGAIYTFVAGDGAGTSGSGTGSTSTTAGPAGIVAGSSALAGYTGAIGLLTPQPSVDVSVVHNLSTGLDTCRMLTLQGLSSTTKRFDNTIDNLSIKAHGITLWDSYSTSFYNSYLTYHLGGPNINVSQDSGLCFVPFCLYPGTYQPSGHINVSRAREFYITVNSSVVNSTNVGFLIIVASAINFLLISDGSAVLRYST